MNELEEKLKRKPAGVFTLSLETIERINVLRAQYILVYLAWVGIQLYFIVRYTQTQGQLPLWPVMVLTNLMYVFFAVRFVQVLRLMRYTFWMYLPACVMAIIPMPGVLMVAYIDRGISKTLRKGLDAREAQLKAQNEQVN